jgi:hypothetical protein
MKIILCSLENKKREVIFTSHIITFLFFYLRSTSIFIVNLIFLTSQLPYAPNLSSQYPNQTPLLLPVRKSSVFSFRLIVIVFPSPISPPSAVEKELGLPL